MIRLEMTGQSVLPADARGVFAELSGLQNMSKATRALLKQPGLNATNASNAANHLTPLGQYRKKRVFAEETLHSLEGQMLEKE